MRKSSEPVIDFKYPLFDFFNLSIYIIPSIIEHGDIQASLDILEALVTSKNPSVLGQVSLKASTNTSVKK